jgi:(p)ppGpp synthase/HD superfamily hydrolase
MKPTESAVWLAIISHQGQVDKSDKPYILHPLRVMGAMEMNDEVGQIVAVLHDVVEDTATTFSIVRTCVGMTYCDTFGVIQAVDAVTRRKDETYKKYIERCCLNTVARRVKVADLQDNMDPRRGYWNEGLHKRYVDSLQYIKLGVWA